jgi:hypothetical protein
MSYKKKQVLQEENDVQPSLLQILSLVLLDWKLGNYI